MRRLLPSFLTISTKNIYRKVLSYINLLFIILLIYAFTTIVSIFISLYIISLGMPIFRFYII